MTLPSYFPYVVAVVATLFFGFLFYAYYRAAKTHYEQDRRDRDKR